MILLCIFVNIIIKVIVNYIKRINKNTWKCNWIIKSIQKIVFYFAMRTWLIFSFNPSSQFYDIYYSTYGTNKGYLRTGFTIKILSDFL